MKKTHKSEAERDLETSRTTALAALLEMAETIAAFAPISENEFISKTLGPFLGDSELAGYDPESIAEEAYTAVGEEQQPEATLINFWIGCAYCAAAMRADDAGEKQLAWNFAVTASRISCGLWTTWQVRKEDGHKRGVIAADGRHAENRAIKSDAIEAYVRGNFANKDEAARHISEEVVPMKFSTVRDWLKGIKK